MFYSAINKPPVNPTPGGSNLEKVYSEVVNEDGTVELKHTGETDRYKAIQECMEETLVYNIIDRALNGNSEVLEKIKGIYDDVLDAPTSLAEAHQQILDTEKMFNQLPVELRKKYKNTHNLINAINNGTFEYSEKIIEKEKEIIEQKQ